MLELLFLGAELLLLGVELELLMDELLVDVLALLLLLLTFTDDELFLVLEELELGLTYSELERT